MKTKKHKVEIPEGYEVGKTITGTSPSKDGNCELITEIFWKKIKKELPKTWEEYIIHNDIYLTEHLSLTKKYSESFVALHRLILLRDVYNDGWKPDYKNNEQKYTITNLNAQINRCTATINDARVLTFKTETLRIKFYDNFKDLIEEAKELL